MEDNSTRKRTSRKAHGRPEKPYPDFPLYAHPLGYWSKKIRGKIKSFGRWARVVNGVLTPLPYQEGWQAALAVYKAQADDLHAGREPQPDNADALTVADLCNRFLTAKKRRLDNGEIGQRMFAEYKAVTDRLVDTFGSKQPVDGLNASDFERLRTQLAEQYGPVRLGNEITKVKTVFKYAAENGLLTRPVAFGSDFRKPSKSVLRRHKATTPKKMMEAEEVRQMLESASQPAKAMLLLMANCGYGAMDCATLPLSVLDLDAGWIIYPRPKTGVERRCPLWPETVAAVREHLARRPKPEDAEAAKLVFLSARGRSMVAANSTANPVTLAILDTMRRAGVHRPGRGAYTLRHVFRTVADAALDRVATDLIMGHSDGSMGAAYRERVDDERLLRVTEHVRRWLFGDGGRKLIREKSDPCVPCDPPTPPPNREGTEGLQGSQKNRPSNPPPLRLFAPEVEGGAA